jgi:ribosomal-protein-alanine N-acetyltransferase
MDSTPLKATTQRARYLLRPMREEDLDQVLAIDREAFGRQWPPLTRGALKQELRNKMAQYWSLVSREPFAPDSSSIPSSSAPGFWRRTWSRLTGKTPAAVEAVPLPPERIVGYYGIWHMVDEVHVISIAVEHSQRRQGLGEYLLLSIIERALALKAGVITLEVRISNGPAQALYLKYGFNEAGQRKGYYADNGEDALIMTTDPIAGAAWQGRYHAQRAKHLATRSAIYA